MPPRRRANRNQQNSSPGYARLEKRLALLAWLHNQLGYKDTPGLLTDLKRADEGFDEEGRSHIYARIASQSRKLQGVTTDDLERYDDNIREHLAKMNDDRTAERITLRYFQYLAALYTEIYLDRYCGDSQVLLRSLNEFVTQHNANCTPDERYQDFLDADLNKLAFWMATGSGKTLLMHLNYRQFLHYNLRYNRDPLDNIILITPNEGLSQQHIEDLRASGIAAKRFDLNESTRLFGETGTVKVTEITKLVEEKKGEGARVPVEAFEGNNLIFVDEGHKGTGSEEQKWIGVRKELGKTGFTFEYSATFGQALAAAKSEALLTEYGKAIAFDYSYRYFYGDGYGKDFNILNLQQEGDAEKTDILLLANLLSFYEQQLVFAEQEKALKPYNLERPLWAFVGHTVQGPKDNDNYQSDVLTVARFLHRVLRDRVWATGTIKQLLQGQSGLTNSDDGKDIFADKYGYLRHQATDAADVYRDALSRVMHSASSSGLHICSLRGNRSELGLKAAGSSEYFGVINVGDAAAFRRLVETSSTDIVTEDDALNDALFDQINEPSSTVEVLVGSRRFVEGWNSWRVSNMGLLNIGRSEGSQIIQLFGRGVRLKGRGMSLKRSSTFVDERHPDHIRSLETLNIFALRANYMAQFRDYLESEGINTDDPVKLPLPIRLNAGFLNNGLVIPRLDKSIKFVVEETVLLECSNIVRTPVSVVMSATVQQLSSQTSRVSELGSQQSHVAESSAGSGDERKIPSDSLNQVDWNQVYLALLQHKEARGFGNLLIRQEGLRSILEADQPVYKLMGEESLVRPRNQAERKRLQEAVTNILRKYADALYHRRKAKWESNNMSYQILDECDENFQLNVGEKGDTSRYIVRAPRRDVAVVEEITQLIADCNALYDEDQGALPRIRFDQHLYQPLLVEASGITSSPLGLQESERTFVADLRDYCASTPKSLPDSPQLFLLRNLTCGKGVGFFESNRFFPDFILWIKSGDKQRIVFVEPHGMLRAGPYANDDKARLHKLLPDLARGMSERSQIWNIDMDSFVVSATPYSELQPKYDDGSWDLKKFAEAHILFPLRNGEYDYLEQILQV